MHLPLVVSPEREGISASACKTCKRCQRRWAFDAIARLPRQQTKSTADGQEGHGMAETFLATGQIPNLTTRMGKVLIKGLHLLPRPGTVHIERPFAFRAFGVLWDGRKDYESKAVPMTGDHKFISDTTKWALSAVQLLCEDQAMLYALDTCIKWYSQWAILDWIFYPKNIGQAKNTRVVVPFSHCYNHVLAHMAPIAWTMQHWRKIFRPYRGAPIELLIHMINSVVPRNTGACYDYHSPCARLPICR